MPSSSTTALRPSLLIHAIEVWHFDSNDELLRQVSLVEIDDSQTNQIRTERLPVAIGEGSLGKACEDKTGILVTSEELADEAICSELASQPTAWLFLPCFDSTELVGAVIFGLSDHEGAVELWQRSDRDELAVFRGLYNGLPSFEFITKYTKFPKGAGLPGTVWQNGLVQLTGNLTQNPSFIRSFGQDPAAVSSAVGIPVATTHGFPASVLLMLEVESSPLSYATFVLDCDVQVDGTERTIQALSKSDLGSPSLGFFIDDDRCLQIAEQTLAAAAPILISIQCEISERSPVCLAVPFFRNGKLNQILCFTV